MNTTRLPRTSGYSDRRGRHPQARPPAHEGAPAVRVQNLQKLKDACGPEHLAMKIGIPLGRLSEMLEGVNFGPELAYHLEVVLRLPSGFMDRPGAVLSESVREQLCALPDEDETPDEPATAPIKPATPTPTISVSQHPQEAPVTATSTVSTPATTPAASAENASEKEVAREIRRRNFEMLTQPKGAKSRLVALTGLSPANISHRLHGHKVFDAETGEYFCGYLGLPSGWFESPRTEADIPPGALALLTGSAPVPSAAPATQPRARSKTALTRPAGAPLAPTRKAITLTEGLSLSSAALGSKPSRAKPVLQKAQVQAPAAPPVTATLNRPPAQAATPAAAAPAPATPAPRLSQSPAAVSLSTAAPVAQAFLLVLTQKIQDGRLPEERALELLQEALSL